MFFLGEVEDGVSVDRMNGCDWENLGKVGMIWDFAPLCNRYDLSELKKSEGGMSIF